MTDISAVIRICYLKPSHSIFERARQIGSSTLVFCKMRNEVRPGRIFGSSRSIVALCSFLLLLTSRISGQIEKETFESAFGLDEVDSADNKEPFHAKSNENHVDVLEKSPETLSEVEDLNEGENNHDEGKREEASPDNEPQPEPKGEIAVSEGISGRMAEEKSGKYVRYGECFDIEWV